MPDYAELHCLSSFSFLRGASQPQELVSQAQALGYQALALTDECSLAGAVRAHQQAKLLNFQLILGSELHCQDDLSVVLLCPTHAAYQQLCRLISRARRRQGKGRYEIWRDDLLQAADNLAILLPRAEQSAADLQADAQWLMQHFPGRAWCALELHRGSRDAERQQELQALSQSSGLPLVACGDVHMHVRERQALQDTMTCIRHGCHLEDAGQRLFPNAERHLRPLEDLCAIYPPAAIAASHHIAQRCHFKLDEIRYRYPSGKRPAGLTAAEHLRQLTEAGLARRWPEGCPEKVRPLIERELKLITELEYEAYFLTVHDIMRWARQGGILCQGRGSAANSAVCFALGITSVDPVDMRVSLLFERFLSRERHEPPDIDVDFEHQRREEVIQHIYQSYGRNRAALAATVICYRPRSALRDVGKALGFSLQDVDRVSKNLAWWDDRASLPQRLEELGFQADAPKVRLWLQLVNELIGFPRHLSQHVGGFVIAESDLDALVPIENAAMADRSILQWDKDDLDALGILKIDCLALGMLSAIRRSFDLIENYRGYRPSIDSIRLGEKAQPDRAAEVYRMLQKADSIGVFQVESRAQMAMLPRLKPREFYDLVIETAIVRPGPIQGGMVHPYLNRRMGREAIDYPPALKAVLERTLGVPIFQEQVMEICVKAAGFSPGEADEVRRSMAAWRRTGSLSPFENRLKEGMHRNGYSAAFAEQIYRQIQGFAEYGFPESHAASFALLIFVSAWLKRFEPEAFLVALLNSQPMGFYSPSQLIQDARRHGVDVRPVDINYSEWESRLEITPGQRPAVRLGLNRIKGLSQLAADKICRSREFESLRDFERWVPLNRRERELLARAGALKSLAGHRHQAHWQMDRPVGCHDLLGQSSREESAVQLSRPQVHQDLLADYQSLGFSLQGHPLQLLRPRLRHERCLSALQARQLSHESSCRIAGLVTNRQRPGTAKGILFLTLEDESGTANLIVMPDILERYRSAILHSRLLLAEGLMENRDGVRHLQVRQVYDRSHWLGDLPVQSRDFH